MRHERELELTGVGVPVDGGRPGDGLVLADVSTRVVFDGFCCRFTYGKALYVRQLLRRLRERCVPVRAVRRVDYSAPGRGRRRGILRLALHPGADPILAVIGEDRTDGLYPYQVEVDAADDPTARRLRDLIHQTVQADNATGAGGFLLPGPTAPRCRSTRLPRTETSPAGSCGPGRSWDHSVRIGSEVHLRSWRSTS
jgi:hypothetical protein